MQLQFAANGSVALKAKQDTVSLSGTVSLAQYEIPGCGEYDVAGIQCEGVATGKSITYFIWLEELLCTYLTGLSPEVSKLDNASNTNLLIAELNSEDTPDRLKAIIKALEPSYVALSGAGNTAEFRKALSLPEQTGTSHKITRSGLPLEGTILLQA